ncbi:MAG: hypothetical protein COA94_08210 [Rickettsiales bacterium]|nr:MAG: hypothetical protein COA94_08210 [Rickettsiales bacterium]
MKFFRFFIIIFLILNSFTIFASDNDIECADSTLKQKLLSGWYLWEPYQFYKITPGGAAVLTGMDVQLVKSLAKRVGVRIEYEEISWNQHQQNIREGTLDIASGATYTKERAEYAYFSDPYRFEENSLFVLRHSEKNLSFETILEFLAQIRLQNFRLGITKGFIYSDPQINLFISDKLNRDIIYQYNDDVEAIESLLKGEIDGVISDRVVGAATILNHKATSLIREVELNIKTPISLMFSKKTVPVRLVNEFNKEIKRFSEGDERNNIVKTYLYPVMLMQTIESNWFYIIGVIGTIAFAISGVAIAAKDNTTLFGTFLFAMLPSVGGGIMRDIMINRDEVGIFLTPSYMYYIIIVVLVGFATIRLLEYYNQKANEDDVIIRFWDNLLILGDALGQASFIVTGVSIAIMSRIEPIILWGPFFAFLTANGGGILRDLLRKKRGIICLNGEINAEISVFWGVVFSVYLDVTSHDPDSSGIRTAVIIIATSAFITRLVTYYLKVPNLKFRK